MNLHRFSPGFVREILLPELEGVVAASQETAPLEYAMERIVRRNSRVIQALEPGQGRWCEIDDLADLERARNIFSRQAPNGMTVEEIHGCHGGY